MLRPGCSREQISSAGRILVSPEGCHLLHMPWRHIVRNVKQRNTLRQIEDLAMPAPIYQPTPRSATAISSPSSHRLQSGRSSLLTSVLFQPTLPPAWCVFLSALFALTPTKSLSRSLSSKVTDRPADEIKNQLSKSEDIDKWARGAVEVEMNKPVETARDDCGVQCSRTECESSCKGDGKRCEEPWRIGR
jgi:hypothetical protein